jgi:hypothetical protein
MTLRDYGSWRCLTTALVLVAACSTPRATEAQVLYGSLVGNVNDSVGGALPGATVTITHNETKATRETVSDGTGAYRFPTVQTGTYTLTANLPGFRTFMRTTSPSR